MGQGVTLPTTSSVPAIPTRNGQSSKRRTMLNRLVHPTAQAVADPTDVLRVQGVREVVLDLTAYPAHVDGGSRRPQWRGRRRPGRRAWCAGRSPCSVPRALPCISRAPLPACAVPGTAGLLGSIQLISREPAAGRLGPCFATLDAGISPAPFRADVFIRSCQNATGSPSPAPACAPSENPLRLSIR